MNSKKTSANIFLVHSLSFLLIQGHHHKELTFGEERKLKYEKTLSKHHILGEASASTHHKDSKTLKVDSCLSEIYFSQLTKTAGELVGTANHCEETVYLETKETKLTGLFLLKCLEVLIYDSNCKQNSCA